jgi:hypothetical protein
MSSPPPGCPYHVGASTTSSGSSAGSCTWSSYINKLTSSTGLLVSATSALVGLTAFSYKYYKKHYANGSIFPSGDHRRVDETVFDHSDLEVKSLLSDPAVAQQFFQAPFTYAQLAHGRVRYQLRHPPAGTAKKQSNLVVFSHGYSIPADIWKPVTDLLLADGYSVLTFDLYGRGFSDAPEGQQFDDRVSSYILCWYYNHYCIHITTQYDRRRHRQA